MNQSPIVFTNKPSKQHPLDDSVWRQRPCYNTISEIKSEPPFLKTTFEDSFIINNYTVRSAVFDEESQYIEVNWKAFKLISLENEPESSYM